ncbi:hypothetical protein D3C85_1742160 [compost metagenome]
MTVTRVTRVAGMLGVGARNPHPRAGFADHFREVAAAQHLGGILPPVRSRRRAGVELVAVAGNHQGIVRVRLPGHQNQAHSTSFTT